MIKNSKYVKINSVNALYLNIGNLNGSFENINKNNYLALETTNESKETKKYEELWSKIRHLTSSITKISDDYDKKHMNIKFNLDDELPLNKAIEIHSMVMVIRAVSRENNKYYPQVFIDDYLCKL